MKSKNYSGWIVGVASVLGCLLLLAVTPAEAAQPSTPQAILSKIGFDRNKLANEALSAARSKGTTEVIVTLAQPDPVTHKSGTSGAQQLEAFRAGNNAAAGVVLGRLSVGDFAERNRFDNFAGFSGMVTEQGLKKLLADPAVKFVEPVRILEAHLAQGISLMNAATVRNTYNGDGLSIAICDTGIDYTHPKLGGGGFPNAKILGGYDFGDSDADPMPIDQPHGTSCAGIVAGETGTYGDYIGGVAYGAKLYALKISGTDTGSATTEAMVAAWDWCVTHQNDNALYPIMVISTSFGGGRYYDSATADADSPGMTTAAANAVAAGIAVLASSGNEGFCDSMGWPAAISSVISVGAVYDAGFGVYTPCLDADSCANPVATTRCATGFYVQEETASDKVTAYSNSASFLTLLAPSNKCYTLDITGMVGYNNGASPGGDYYSAFGGTSAACPYAAGAVASLQSAAKAVLGRWLTVAEVRSTLTSTGVSVTDSKVAITKPRVDLGAAVDSLFSVKAFTWTPVSSPKTTGTPFNVTLTAVDGAGTKVAGFNGTADLAGLILAASPVTIGAGTDTMSFPMSTFYQDERTQVIYLASEIGGAQSIGSLSLNVVTPPGQTLSGWTVRMKHTALNEFASADWEGDGWTTVYQATEAVNKTGWAKFDFPAPFAYDGVNNLMVDFSFNNETWSANGLCRSSAPGGNRTVSYRSDSVDGDPLTWSGATPAGVLSTYVPNIRLGAPDIPVAISPTTSGTFVNGVWTGSVTVPGIATGMALRADDGNGHFGDSNVFNVSSDSTPPTGTIVINSNRTATKTVDASLALTWDDGIDGSGVTRMRFSNDGATWTAWETLKLTRVYTLPGGDGYKTVRVQYLDKASNKSLVYNDYIRLDTVTPTGGILINNGAATTTTQAVTLKLNWSDVGSGVTRMRFSDNGSTWTAWESPKATRGYSIPAGLGNHTVRVQYTDAAENYSPIYNDYIKLIAP